KNCGHRNAIRMRVSPAFVNMISAWDQSRRFTVRRSLPVYPEKQTFSEPIGMSQRCPNNGSDQTHSITSSARRRREGGIWMPKDRAVAELMTNSNAVGC